MKAFILITSIISCLSPLQAQESTLSVPQPETVHDKALKFRTAGWQTIKEPLYYRAYREPKRPGGEAEEVYKQVTLSEMEQSTLRQTMPSHKVRFYTRSQQGEESLYQLAAEVPVKHENGQYLFLFFPKKETGKLYQVYAIPDSQEDSPFGAYQFHNLTQQSLQGKLGKRRFQLSPKRRVTTQSFQHDKKVPLPFGLYQMNDGKPSWLARNTYHYHPDKHLKVFIYSTKDVHGREKYKVKGLVDFYTPPPQP